MPDVLTVRGDRDNGHADSATPHAGQAGQGREGLVNRQGDATVTLTQCPTILSATSNA